MSRVDTYAATCPCTCHGRGSYALCDPQYPAGCGHLHQAAPTGGCPACHIPVSDGALCTTCTRHLATDLEAVPALAHQLAITRAKLDQIGERNPRGGSNVPLGFRPTAVEVADVLHMTLAVWARELATSPAAPGPLMDVPAEDPAELARYLRTHLEKLRHLVGTGQLTDEVGYAVKVTRRAVDRPADRVYVGPCDHCRYDLYARPHAAEVACTQCATVYLVEERRVWLLEALREHLATAAEIARGLGDIYGQPISRKTINQWHHRERLVEHGATRDGWPLFRIGDVLDLTSHGDTPRTG